MGRLTSGCRDLHTHERERSSAVVGGLMRIVLALVVVAPATAGALVGCDAREPAAQGADSQVCRVVVSVAPHEWLVRQIGGEHVQVAALVEPGESPHTYQPSDAQITAAVHSELYFRTGVPFENGPWLEAVASVENGPTVVDLRQGVTLRSIEAHAHEGPAHDDADQAPDPHIWLAPQALKIQAATVARTLTSRRPEYAESFAANLVSLQRVIEQTDAAVAAKLAPFAGRRVYVFHPAWGYFTDAYHLEQVAVEVGGNQPTEHELTELQAAARHDRVRAIFVQPQISSRTAEALARTIGGRVVVLDPLSEDIPANLLAAADAIAAALGPQESGSAASPPVE